MEKENESAVLSVSQCAEYLQLSRMATYQGIWKNQIPHIRVGRRILIPKFQLAKMLEGKSNDN